ncbi:MAG TPA: TonB-dependent receptor, partial [Daejeonella sp.]|nr:TonB-dependent receptor [Daejeonella sp.]
NETSVGELNAPDKINGNASLTEKLFDRQERSRIESAIPKHKVNLTANYTGKSWGLIARTVRFGEVAYNNPFDSAFPEGNTPIIPDQTFSAKWVTDLTADYSLTNQLNIAFGVNNLFDIYPNRVYMDPGNRQDNLTGDQIMNYQSSAARDNSANGRIPFSRNVTQFGFNGRHLYGRLTYSL